MAKELGFKDANIAKTRWSQIRRKKILPASGTAAVAATAGVSKKKTAAASKTKGATGARKTKGLKGEARGARRGKVKAVAGYVGGDKEQLNGGDEEGFGGLDMKEEEVVVVIKGEEDAA